MHTTLFAQATNELKNVIFKKKRKNLLKAKFQMFGVFLKLTRPVYYQLNLNLIKNFNKTIFLQKACFCILNKKKRGLKDNFSENRQTFAH